MTGKSGGRAGPQLLRRCLLDDRQQQITGAVGTIVFDEVDLPQADSDRQIFAGGFPADASKERAQLCDLLLAVGKLACKGEQRRPAPLETLRQSQQRRFARRGHRAVALVGNQRQHRRRVGRVAAGPDDHRQLAHQSAERRSTRLPGKLGRVEDGFQHRPRVRRERRGHRGARPLVAWARQRDADQRGHDVVAGQTAQREGGTESDARVQIVRGGKNLFSQRRVIGHSAFTERHGLFTHPRALVVEGSAEHIAGKHTLAGEQPLGACAGLGAIGGGR